LYNTRSHQAEASPEVATVEYMVHTPKSERMSNGLNVGPVG
jgi:hypothetical protein